MISMLLQFPRGEGLWDNICSIAEGMFPAPVGNDHEALYRNGYVGPAFERICKDQTTTRFQFDSYNKIAPLDETRDVVTERRVSYNYSIDGLPSPIVDLSETTGMIIHVGGPKRRVEYPEQYSLIIKTGASELPLRHDIMRSMGGVSRDTVSEAVNSQRALRFVGEMLRRLSACVEGKVVQSVSLHIGEMDSRDLMQRPMTAEEKAEFQHGGIGSGHFNEAISLERLILACNVLGDPHNICAIFSLYDWVVLQEKGKFEAFADQLADWLHGDEAEFSMPEVKNLTAIPA